jgi:hypothetical protein
MDCHPQAALLRNALSVLKMGMSLRLKGSAAQCAASWFWLRRLRAI